MLNFIKKSLSYLVTGSCSIVFAACYGPKVSLGDPKQINVKNSDNQAIQGLKVTLFENRKAIDERFTDKSGIVVFNFVQKENYSYTATIQDVDGIENGAFKTGYVDLSKDSFLEINLESED